MKRKYVIALTACLLLFAPLAVWAGGQSESGSKSAASSQATIRVMWWGDQKRADITNQMLNLFQQKYPQIKVQAEFSPFSGFFDKLNTEVASGTAPDLFTLGSNILDYAQRGVLLNLNPYVGKIIDTSGISKSLMEFNTIDGKLDGISVGANSRAILANETMFQKAGVALPPKSWGWSDYAKIANELSQKLGSGYWGSYDYSGMYDAMENYYKQRGEENYDNKTKKLGFTVASAIKWFTYWADLRKAGGAVPADVQVATGPPADVSKSLILTGKVAMVYIPTNQLGSYQSLTKDKLVFLPLPKGPDGYGIDVESSQNIVGYAKTKYPEAVARLMNFWVNDPGAAKALGNNRGVPVAAKMRALLEKDATPTDKEIYTYLDFIAKNSDVKPTYNMPGFNQFNHLLISVSQEIAFGKTSIASGVNQLYTQGAGILASALNQ